MRRDGCSLRAPRRRLGGVAVCVLAVAGLSLGGCGSARLSVFRQGAHSCSCAGTDCPCLGRHAQGQLECYCRATDAYPDDRVGGPDDQR